ncbi:hypothetical protein FGIG_04991, partial [Fasciola gigantica]
DTPPEHLWPYLLPLLDDDAARQFLATGVPILPVPDIIWPALEEFFARYVLASAFFEKFLGRRQLLADSVDEYAACLRVLATKAYPKAYKEVRDKHILGLFTIWISDSKTKEDFLLNMLTFSQSALLRARKLKDCREALRQLPNKTIATMQPAVFKPQPSRTPSVSYLTAVAAETSDRGPNTVDTTRLCSTPVSPSIVLCPYPFSLNNNDWQSPLVVEGLLNGKGAKLLIDTGASRSVINSSLTKISHSVPPNGRLIAANLTVMPILGQVAGSTYVIRLIQNPGSEALTVHYNQLKPANDANPTNT